VIGGPGQHEYDAAVEAAIDGVATLYMWDAHDGCRPVDARSTRSWAVRDWMKANGFGQFTLPGLHLRDAVVERLRQYGMVLTPKPLAMSAFEYWSMRYDRKYNYNAVSTRRVNEPLQDEGAALREAPTDTVSAIDDEFVPQEIEAAAR